MKNLQFDIPGLDNEDIMRAQKEAEKDIKNETKKSELLSKHISSSRRLPEAHSDTGKVGEGSS